MPLQDRKPNLASLVVPAPRSISEMREEVHTPLPHSPFVYEPYSAPLVMTPDTPSFKLPGIEATLSATAPASWSDDEDSLILSYIFHPPRPLRTAYPPGSLPPADAIDELTSQLIQSPVWSSGRTWDETRSRIFEVARKNSADVLGGHRREEIPNLNTGFSRPRVTRPKLAVLGSAGMNRQQHSMDSLYGDSEQPLSETLRLSSTLQDTAARGSADQLTSTESLSSPLTFTFTFNQSSRKPMLPNSYPPRPTSLLQRGRSFTSQDIHRSIPSTIDEYLLSSDEEGSSPKRPDMVRSVSSPISSLSSPQSSVSSSHSISEDADESQTTIGLSGLMGLTGLVGYGSLQDVEIDAEPFTPLNQTFTGIYTLPPRIGATTTPSGTDLSTPAITLTADSPTYSRTPRLLNPATSTTASASISSGSGSGSASASASGSKSTSSPTMSPTHTARQLANLSLDSRGAAPPPPPSAKRRTSAGLTRSFSDGIVTHAANRLTTSNSVNSSLSTLTFSALPPAPRHPLGRPMIKRQRSNGPGLSVFVPRPAARTWSDELRSPFEHKPVSGVANE